MIGALVDEYDVDDVSIELTECCGIEELYNLDVPNPAIITKVYNDSNRRAMIIFHDVVSWSNGSSLASYIRRNKLGSLTSSKKVMNPNSRNIIQMWIWYPDWDAIDKIRRTYRMSYD